MRGSTRRRLVIPRIRLCSASRAIRNSPASARKDSASACRRTSTRLRGRGDCDPAAGLLLERHLHALGRQLERPGDVVADAHGERLAERALVAKAGEVELERLRLEAEALGPVADGHDVEVRLSGDRADRRQLVAAHLDLGDAGVRERLETGEVLRARVAEGHELVAAFHHPRTVRRVPRVYLAGPPFADEYRLRPSAHLRDAGWE